MTFKAYYFDGDPEEVNTSDMVKVYEGDSEDEAHEAIAKYERDGIQVEIWAGEDGDDTTDELIYP
jgi:hypothetical protein